MVIKNSLLHKIQLPGHLHRAWFALNKSNRDSRGISDETIEDFSANLGGNIAKIRKGLREENYQFQPVRGVLIPEIKPSGEVKKRPIRSPDIRDRVVQKAIALALEPVLEKKYQLRNDASFAYLAKRSIRDALVQMLVLYKKGNPIVLEADLQDFFGTVDQDKLLNQFIFPALPDATINSLITAALTQEVGNRDTFEEGDRELFQESTVGIPQGGGLSPLFANVYLKDFDHAMLKTGFGLVRYADDFIVLCKDQKEAEKAHKLAAQILENELGLKLHPLHSQKTRIVRPTQEKFEFLGVRFDGKQLWPSGKKIDGLKLKINEIVDPQKNHSIVKLLMRSRDLLVGWISAYSYTCLAPWIKELDHHINMQIGKRAFNLGWTRKNSLLTKEQRLTSGIPSINATFKKARESLESKYQKAFGVVAKGATSL